MVQRISLWSLIYLAWLAAVYFLMDISIGQCISDSECIFVAMLGSSLASMPISILWIGCVNLIFYLFDILLSGAVGLVISLIGFYVLGYFQWFILTPSIFKKIRNYKLKKTT